MKFSNIYTGKGDDGFTSLYVGGRVAKSSQYVTTVSKFDKLNCVLGSLEDIDFRREIQEFIMNLMTKLMTRGEVKSKEYLDNISNDALDKTVHYIRSISSFLDSKYPEGQKHWSYYGDCPASLVFHNVCVTIREAEVELIKLWDFGRGDTLISTVDVKFINALSKLFYLYAREVELKERKE